MMFNEIWPSTSYSSQYFTASYRTIFCDCEISLSSYLTAVASYNYSKVVKGSFDYSFNDNTIKSSCWVHVLTNVPKNVILEHCHAWPTCIVTTPLLAYISLLDSIPCWCSLDVTHAWYNYKIALILDVAINTNLLVALRTTKLLLTST